MEGLIYPLPDHIKHVRGSLQQCVCLSYLDLFLFNLSSIRLTKVITLEYFRQLELHEIFGKVI